MKILHLSGAGDGCDLAIDAVRWGHQVKLFIEDPKHNSKRIYDGMIDKADRWQDWVDWCDFAFCDSNNLTDIWQKIVKKKPIFGGSVEGQKLEKDRALAHKLMADVGMKRFESKSFKTIKEAQDHLKEHKVKHVAKIVGKDAGSDDVLISEMDGGDDAIELMQQFEEAGKKYDVVEVEERVFGVEVGCARYHAGKAGWVGPVEINWQHKETASGRPGTGRGTGPLCGETGTVIKYVDESNAFYQKTLALFSEYLKKIDYRGEIDLGTITNEQGIFPIEFTPRKGYPDCFIRRSLTVTPEPDLYYAIAQGKTTEYKIKPGWAVGVLVMSPGFSYQEAVQDHSMGYPVYVGGSQKYDGKNPDIHLQEVKKGKRGIEVADGAGYAAVVTGSGPTIESAQRRAYWQLSEANPKRLYIPKMAYRPDIGNRVIEQKEEILELGIMTQQEWENA